VPSQLPQSVKRIVIKNYIYIKNEICFVLNKDEMVRDEEYVIYPVDEVGMSGVDKGSSRNFGKGNFDVIKVGKRYVAHNLDLPTHTRGYPVEFEERCDRDVYPLHKYLHKIIILSKNISNTERKMIDDYLIKYPHIQLEIR
jgi:hypothetical protein